MNQTPQSPNRLKAAVQSEAVPPYLAARIRAQVQQTRPRRVWLMWGIPAVATAALALGLGIAYQLGHLRLTISSQNSYIATVASRISSLMAVGLGDHIHCSVFRKYPKNPPKPEEVVSKLKPEYAPLVPIVRDNVPSDYKLMLAHECRFNKRRFVHLSLMNGSNLLSLVMVRKEAGESFNVDKVLPSLSQAGLPMYQSGVQRFAITAFESRDHAVYFISDLPAGRNTELMMAMAPGLREYLAQREL